jgi:DNA mismatch repair ATPase MutL
MLNPESPTHVYLGRIPKWLKELELTKWERKLIRSIQNKKKANIAFYIKQVKCTQQCYNAIKKYYMQVLSLPLKNKSLDAINYKKKSKKRAFATSISRRVVLGYPALMISLVLKRYVMIKFIKN